MPRSASCLLLFGLAALAPAVSAFAQTVTVTAETRTSLRQLTGDLVLSGQAYELDHQLADTIGPRLTGSANYLRAADWAQERFRSFGLANVHTELWIIPATWEPETAATGHILTPVDHTLHIYSQGWSPSTPAGGVTGKVVYLKSFDRKAIDEQRSEITGNIVFFDRDSAGERPDYSSITAALIQLKNLKPLALVSGSSAKNGAEDAGSGNDLGQIDPLPAAQIGFEDALLLRRLLDRGPVTLQFQFTNRIREHVEVPNVVAEIPGRNRSLPVVLLGAHLDSWHPGTGAQDNGTGVAGLLDIARAVHALPQPPLRTIRFVLFGGEEEGLLGSNAYVKQHLAEIKQIDAVLISDTGAEPAKGWYLMGRDDERAALANIEPLLAPLSADGTTDDVRFLFDTDHAAFDVHGVPSLVLWTGTDKYFTLHHQPSDTFDSVVAKDLEQGTMVMAVTAFALADSPEPFAKHLTDKEVQAMLKQYNKVDEWKSNREHGTLP